MHPSERLYGSTDNRLGGNTVLLCITGSIAATETVKLAREIIRHGGRVVPLMTRAAVELIGPKSIEFACGNAPVTDLTGRVEHISLLSGGKSVVVVAPATADVIGKIANGIADDAVTALCLNALGSAIPVIIAPSMGATMLDNPFVRANMDRLRRQGVNVLPSVMAENEAKLPDFQSIISEAARCFSGGRLKRRSVLVVGGAGEQPLDEVRFITSRSSGATAVEIATAAYEQKANVMMLSGRMEVSAPSFIPSRRFRTLEDIETFAAGRRFDIVIVPASLPDFIPAAARGKISSDRDVTLRLKRAPKFIDDIRGRCRVLVAFKAETGGEKQLIEKARTRLKQSGADIIVANNISDVGANSTRAFIVTEDDVQKFEGTKRGLAELIIDRVCSI
ncbi:MAG: bifunctional phosphopantothenoylcysteine decarboxylase/phosphopantothenate--cysteine ligase CoaBC [Thermoplasmata archaeon]|uniref:Bifunctional phosphopantothenoylcysteine decarboxylase/phosphopantothenate--cysteine ligase CoaBC n=1 Tax=Candidatus Sysuiplasma superficiale TaxID=2823368 RepID=A0A8J8CE95_9ARCH|nr:bifunctional phosphopantothenoylcysteine decarboxylase/phosphopantothenate--cysteine ligase CoaBC [Candidatus Sysuiplasma superficiale]